MKTRDLRVWGTAGLAALCVLLAAWLLPLPRLVAGADALATAPFPLADYRRLYPAPVGDLTPDIPWTHASEVASEAAALREHIAALDSAFAAHDASASKAVATNINADGTRVWALGRSVERIE